MTYVRNGRYACLTIILLIEMACFGAEAGAEDWSWQETKIIQQALIAYQGDIDRNLNDKIPHEVYRVSGLPVKNGVTVQIIVNRNGNISSHFHVSPTHPTLPVHPALRASSNARYKRIIVLVIADVPLRFDLRGDWKKCKRIKYVVGSHKVCAKHHEDTSGSIIVHLRTRILISDNQNITTNSTPSFSWTEKPFIKIGPARIRVSGVVGKQIQKQLDRLARILDQKAKGYVEKALDKLP